MEASDRAAVDKIVAKLKDNEYRLADLITEVVTSDMFQKRLMLLCLQILRLSLPFLLGRGDRPALSPSLSLLSLGGSS